MHYVFIRYVPNAPIVCDLAEIIQIGGSRLKVCFFSHIHVYPFRITILLLILFSALSIYCRSPAAYDTLRSWKIFQLPSKSSLKQFTTTLLHGTRPYYDFLDDQRKRYLARSPELVSKGKAKPLCQGVLILDEVKVIGKVAWNSKSGKMCGVVMEEGEYASLVDIYDDLKTTNDVPKAAEYFLQFLWRDMTSNFDVIGPHYSWASTMDSVFLQTCFTDTLAAFQAYGFKVSTNLQVSVRPKLFATVRVGVITF